MPYLRLLLLLAVPLLVVTLPLGCCGGGGAVFMSDEAARRCRQADGLIAFTETYNSANVAPCSVVDDVFAGTTASPAGVPFGSAGASCGGSSRDTGIYYNDDLDGLTSYAGGRVENLFDRDVGVDFRGLGGQGTAGGGSGGALESGLTNFTPPGLVIEEALEALSSRSEQELLAEIEARKEAPRSKKPRSWKPSALRPNTSRLLVGREDALPQTSFKASVRIDGFRARTVLDLVFRNDRDKQLHGSFQLRLPDGASVHYLAFGKTAVTTPVFMGNVPSTLADIRMARPETWEKPKEARMVPRERAAHAFEETVQQQIDPALAEWTGAGVFSVQVYPLEAKALHRIVVAYDTDLLPVRGGLLYRLDLPQGVKDVHVDLEAHGGQVAVAPKVPVAGGIHRWHNPQHSAILAGYAKDPTVVLHGADPETGAYFAARVTPTLPDLPAAPRERAVFLVDTSLSSNPERMNTWLALLREILSKNRPQLKAFKVLFFNVDARWWRDDFATNTQANVDALLAYASGLALEGATDLGRALRAGASPSGAYDVFLLSDGAVTWGEDDLHVLAHTLGEDHALFAYRMAAAGTHIAALNQLARTTGGAVFQVPSDAAIARAARAHRSRPWRILSVTVEGAPDVLLAGRPANLYPGQTLYVAGREHPAADAVLELRLEQAGREQIVRTPLGKPLRSPLAARTYGQTAVGTLESLGSSGETLATAYANHFRVVGRSSSLLMLESEEDYTRYGIKPADDAARVRKDLVSVPVARAALQSLTLREGNHRQRFLHRLDQLRKIDFLGLSFPAGFDAALTAMPASAFDVAPTRRAARVSLRSQLPAGLASKLAKRELTYTGLRTEAERRRQAHGAWDGLKALSSLLEATPGDLDLARDLGFTAMAWGLDDQAYHLLRRVYDRRPYQLPTLLAMARCASALGKHDLALVHYETALASRQAERYGAFREIATLEYLTFLDETRPTSAFARQRADALEANRTVKEADLVVLLTWNTDRTDVDLHVTDPRGEECYYEHPKTKLGGRITADVTQGFGPEMFVLERAVPGNYKVEVNYFGSDAARTLAPSRVYVRVFENYGRTNERLIQKTVELSEKAERRTVLVVKR